MNTVRATFGGGEFATAPVTYEFASAQDADAFRAGCNFAVKNFPAYPEDMDLQGEIRRLKLDDVMEVHAFMKGVEAAEGYTTWDEVEEETA